MALASSASLGLRPHLLGLDGPGWLDAAPVCGAGRTCRCNPPKKGYGSSTPGLMFGPGPRKGERAQIGKEYEHAPDPYDAPREVRRRRPAWNAGLAAPWGAARAIASAKAARAPAVRLPPQAVKAERRHAMEMLEGRAPYRTMGASIDFFDGHKRTAAPKGLTEDPIIPPREEPPKPEPVSHLPFYPAKVCGRTLATKPAAKHRDPRRACVAMRRRQAPARFASTKCPSTWRTRRRSGCRHEGRNRSRRGRLAQRRSNPRGSSQAPTPVNKSGQVAPPGPAAAASPPVILPRPSPIPAAGKPTKTITFHEPGVRM